MTEAQRGTNFQGPSSEHQVFTLGDKKPSWRMVQCSIPHRPWSSDDEEHKWLKTLTFSVEPWKNLCRDFFIKGTTMMGEFILAPYGYSPNDAYVLLYNHYTGNFRKIKVKGNAGCSFTRYPGGIFFSDYIERRSRAGAALGSRTSELGSGTPWAEADRGRELEQIQEQEMRSGFRVRRIAG
uniref:F-box associated beta-propeller type 3 domain-containing protein n=1 Tax=Brassica oleracea var. oleracea TaxID=109376 RepID=A0A0D3EF86_BRAOL